MATLHDNDNTLLALVRTTFDAHSAVLFLPDQSGNYTVALSSTDNEPSVQEVTIAPGKGLVGWILRHKQPVIVNNLDMRHTFLGYYDENDEGAISAFMGCHIPEGGALCVDSDLIVEQYGIVKVKGKENDYPSNLSGGEQQRVAIARALAVSPEAILCDEPTGALDKKTGKQIMDLLHQVVLKNGIMLLIVTHDLDIAKTCNTIFEMDGGRLQCVKYDS